MQIIFDGPQHTVTSYGNGMAYLVRRNETGEEFFVQGEDATAFYSDVFDQDMLSFSEVIDALYGDEFYPNS